MAALDHERSDVALGVLLTIVAGVHLHSAIALRRRERRTEEAAVSDARGTGEQSDVSHLWFGILGGAVMVIGVAVVVFNRQLVARVHPLTLASPRGAG